MNPLTKILEEQKKEFIEAGAAIEHARWAWNRQIVTSYENLSEAEKESDRKEVRTYLPLLSSSYTALLTALVEEIDKKKESDGKPHDDTMELHQAVAWQDGFNAALSDIKNLILDALKK